MVAARAAISCLIMGWSRCSSCRRASALSKICERSAVRSSSRVDVDTDAPNISIMGATAGPLTAVSSRETSSASRTVTPW